MKKVFIQIHKIAGSLLSLVFLMWCLSGIALLIKGFPHASRQDRFENLEYFNESDFVDIPFFSETSSGKIELEKYQGKSIYRKYKGRKIQNIYDAHTLKEYKVFTKSNAVKEAEHYLNVNILRVDSITEIDSWIPWGYYKPLLPFYKCYMADAKCSVIYISSQTGTVIQHTTRYSRWMARIGAIPHILYFYQIKQFATLWKNTVLVLGIIGIFVSLSGLIASFFRLRRNATGKIIGISVYKKLIYRWHHILGLFIGIFFFTFLLSGIFYATGIPSWICEKSEVESPQKLWNQRTDTESTIYPERIWTLLPEKEGLRKITWTASMGNPVIEAYYDNYKSPYYYAANNDTLVQFSTTKEKIYSYAQKVLKNKVITISIQEEYDNYYKSQGMYYHSLPAYKLNLNDAFNTVIFIDPESGRVVEYFNNNKRVRRWLTRGLHKLNFSIFKNVEWLRITILIILCVGGILVSFTGVLLSWKWLKRLIKQLKRKIFKSKLEHKIKNK